MLYPHSSYPYGGFPELYLFLLMNLLKTHFIENLSHFIPNQYHFVAA